MKTDYKIRKRTYKNGKIQYRLEKSNGEPFAKYWSDNLDSIKAKVDELRQASKDWEIESEEILDY